MVRWRNELMVAINTVAYTSLRVVTEARGLILCASLSAASRAQSGLRQWCRGTGVKHIVRFLAQQTLGVWNEEETASIVTLLLMMFVVPVPSETATSP